MLDKLAGSVEGYKTYILSAVGILVALAGKFWGPIHITDALTIPQLGWSEVWAIVWNGGLFSALHAKK